MIGRGSLRYWLALTTLFTAAGVQAEVSALLDLRAVYSDAPEGWLNRGLGKQRFDRDHGGLKLGQAVLEARLPITATLNGKIAVNAYDDRSGAVDLTEAVLTWKPLPVAGYRVKTRLGAFFPGLSQENTGPGWTSPWMLSTSAINTWIGEEFRTLGGEITLGRPGQLHDSLHDVDAVAALYTANDPAGGVLTWRGWTVGDRITGLTERLPLPDFPVYGPNGALPYQVDWEEPFHEIDHRLGYYAGLNYGYAGWLKLQWLYYDNNGNPRAARNGQYAWATTFQHLGLRLDLPQDWTVLSQAMVGETAMGRSLQRGVYADFDAWYVLLSKAVGAYRWSLRYDAFAVEDEDRTPEDDNSEDGQALALALQYRLNDSRTVGAEVLRIWSVHAGREYLHDADDEAAATKTVTETSAQLFYRQRF